MKIIKKVVNNVKRVLKGWKFDTIVVTTSVMSHNIKLIDKDDFIIAQGFLSGYPNCCGVAVLNGIRSNINDSGFGTQIVEKLLAIAVEQKFTHIQATTNGTSPEMEHILDKFGFKVIDEFVNKKTNNSIKVWSKNLQ